MNIILFLINHWKTYWKASGVILLAAAFLISAHMAQERGRKLKMSEQILQESQENFRAQIKIMEKTRQDEKERNDFRKKQNRKIKLADNDGLRDAYDGLRERQRTKAAR